MRFLLFISLFVSLSLAKTPLTLGAGAYFQSQPYKGLNTFVLPSPVIFYDNGLIYARWSRFGIYFAGEKKDDTAWGFSFTLQPRTLGYKASQSSYLQGMKERDATFEGGIAFSASFYETHYIELMLLHDLLNRYNSYIFRAEIGSEFSLGKFSFYPSIVTLYEPQAFVNYYYGVEVNEARTERPFYRPSGGFEYGLQTYIKYPLNKNFSLLANLRYDKIPSSAANSPLTEKNYIYSGLFSLIYTFKE